MIQTRQKDGDEAERGRRRYVLRVSTRRNKVPKTEAGKGGERVRKATGQLTIRGSVGATNKKHPQ